MPGMPKYPYGAGKDFAPEKPNFIKDVKGDKWATQMHQAEGVPTIYKGSNTVGKTVYKTSK